MSDIKSCNHKWHEGTCILPAVERERDAARTALNKICQLLDLVLPSKQTGPEWEKCIQVPITRMAAINKILEEMGCTMQHETEQELLDQLKTQLQGTTDDLVRQWSDDYQAPESKQQFGQEAVNRFAAVLSEYAVKLGIVIEK